MKIKSLLAGLLLATSACGVGNPDFLKDVAETELALFKLDDCLRAARRAWEIQRSRCPKGDGDCWESANAQYEQDLAFCQEVFGP